ncbi:MAG: ribosome-associated translation inhibitor RaiA [Gemmatimonadetes bacterium]|nr:ribosome-associated translation inhibitor RaiA [Gemmatimonadota bacterium]
MQKSMTARHCELAEAYKEHADREIDRLNRYSDNILSADLIVSQEKYRFMVELNVHVEGHVLTSKEENAEAYTALDQAVNKMESQLKKHNGKLHDHRNRRH